MILCSIVDSLLISLTYNIVLLAQYVSVSEWLALQYERDQLLRLSIEKVGYTIISDTCTN